MSKHHICSPKPCPPDDYRPPHDDCYKPPFEGCMNPPINACDCHSKHTTKYFHLPLWRANDVTSWLYGINSAMMRIDDLFHMFALRTSIDGSSDELADAVNKLEKRVECLQADNTKNLETIANLSKVITDMISTGNIRDDKIKHIQDNSRYTRLLIEGNGTAISNLKEKINMLEVKVIKLEGEEEPGEEENGGENNDTNTGGTGNNNNSDSDSVLDSDNNGGEEVDG